MPYRVELTGHTKYYYVLDRESGQEYTVVRFHDVNCGASDWEVMRDDRNYIDNEEQKKELIEAVTEAEKEKPCQ